MNMFKLFVLYPFILLVCFWLASDVELKTSLSELEESSLFIHFPKESLRSEGAEPWIDFYWDADHESINIAA